MVQPALYDQSLPPMLSFCVAWGLGDSLSSLFYILVSLTREFLLKPLLSSRLFSSCSCFTIFLLILSHFLFLISFCRSSLILSPLFLFLFSLKKIICCAWCHFFHNYYFLLFLFSNFFLILYYLFSSCIVSSHLILSLLTSHRISFFPHFLFSFSLFSFGLFSFSFFFIFIDLVFFSPIFLLCSTQWWSVTK